MQKSHPFVEHIEITYEGNSNGLEAVAVIRTNLPLHPQHPNYDDDKLNEVIEFCMGFVSGDFPVASKIRIVSSNK